MANIADNKYNKMKQERANDCKKMLANKKNKKKIKKKVDRYGIPIFDTGKDTPSAFQ